MAGVLLPAATTLFLSGTQKPAAGPAPPGSIAGMRAVAIVVAGLLSCAGAACGGASDAFSSSDSGMDATASESDGAPRSAVPATTTRKGPEKGCLLRDFIEMQIEEPGAVTIHKSHP